MASSTTLKYGLLAIVYVTLFSPIVLAQVKHETATVSPSTKKETTANNDKAAGEQTSREATEADTDVPNETLGVGDDSDSGAENADDSANDPGPVEGGGFKRSGRMEFDERLVKGQAAKSGAVYLFKRTPRRLPGLVPFRRSYRTRIVEPVLGERELKAPVYSNRKTSEPEKKEEPIQPIKEKTKIEDKTKNQADVLPDQQTTKVSKDTTKKKKKSSKKRRKKKWRRKKK